MTSDWNALASSLTSRRPLQVELDDPADRGAGLVRLLLDSFALFLAGSDEVDLDPIAGERPNDRQPDAGGAPGNKCDAVRVSRTLASPDSHPNGGGAAYERGRPHGAEVCSIEVHRAASDGQVHLVGGAQSAMVMGSPNATRPLIWLAASLGSG